ncbi:hypothetical protein IV55_GL000666 [Furfurilactobacillus siliginis]|uniref:Enterocin A Immunity superfamily protein n=2 Tax=Furfurilactobacillus siliginis TaxID=348151 RepID=A0A0R2KWF9_9LACO|nr:bacteriocin immunity protein [Furfurilactobacillus siliginis]KRN93864.1 hypothetical protein IV55_GL000666 [Furfurilactobacillus siliginis]GEK29055.1 enterocin A Immunity superfamily protein [Furfurilactobacillus siliginis]
MKQTEAIQQAAKDEVHELYNRLSQRTEQSVALLDITDVLMQVYRKIDTTERPEQLLDQLMNYIRNTSMVHHLHFSRDEEANIINLETLGTRVGFNSRSRSVVTKQEFYKLGEVVPQHSAK